ncbi:hypothetical protein [Gordonia insulae]|uniref:Transmembrane protein n=1 Tax=Gordonia insulae TaxID=2420509 RepID=A0A3G8JSR4_9ACTN|nr:hypothetical protein [Gordonia insulae]AZG47953.1 hypothetical protein D7316_04565 [Gordonia insulae]
MTILDAERPGDTRGFGDRLRDNILLRLVLRWVVLVGMAVFAYWSTLDAILVEAKSGTLITYLPAAVVLTLMACIGIGLRQGDEFPIYDRQTDIIVGTVTLVLSLCIEAMLTPRYASTYLSLHIDLLSMWLFLLGGAVMLFGLRPVARYRWAWFLLLSIFPLPYRILVITFGATRVAASIVMLILAVGAAAVAVGRTRRRGLAGAALAAVAGIMVLVALKVYAPDAPIYVYQWVPPVACVFVTGVVMYIDQRRDWGHLKPLERPLNPITAPDVLRGTIFTALVAVLITLIPVPDIRPSAGVTVPGLNMTPPLSVPSNWRQVSVKPYDVSSLYGPGAAATRQDLRQAEGDVKYDKFSRPRKVVVDAITTSRPLTLDVYSTIVDYNLVGDRFSRRVPVPLPHGMNGVLQTIVDDTNFLTYNRLVWRWNDGGVAQQVSLISVDDHEPDAIFPQPQLTLWRNVNSLITVLFRGNSVTEDKTPVFKDRDLLVMCASDLIETQIDKIGQVSS